MSWTLCSKKEVSSIYKIDEASLKDFWSETVESMIKGYLRAPYIGEAPVSITEKHSGRGISSIGLNSPPVVEVTSLSVQGTEVEQGRYENLQTLVVLTDGSVFPKGVLNVSVTYLSGGKDIPKKVSLAAATMIAAIATYEGRAGTDGTLRYGDLPPYLGGETAVRNMGLIAHLEAIMHTMLDKYKLRVK